MATASNEWNLTDIPDQTGRTAIVTGGNSGVGLATVEALAAAGAHVVLAVRDVKRGEAVAATMRGSLEVRRLDLADLASVREFAAAWTGDLDLLINNAGVMNPPKPTMTKDGFEMQLGINHLGHFALTNLLLPRLIDRVVTVSSSAHKTPGSPRINFNNLNLTGEYVPMKAYSQSKLANLLFTLELQRRLAAARSPLRALAAHPGLAKSNLNKYDKRAHKRLVRWAGSLISQDPGAGALPTLYAALQDLPGASYVGPDAFGELRGAPTLVGRSAAASDPVSARRLWALSEELTATTFPEPAVPARTCTSQ
ncbi:oxidoreductase [Streptomyces sp. NPDC006923]|uniref:oxidoreductase n=1 Tax=Streptomyces sp. NPDC006923 TaxID=3155355 RepID=UPI0034035D9D